MQRVKKFFTFFNVIRTSYINSSRALATSFCQCRWTNQLPTLPAWLSRSKEGRLNEESRRGYQRTGTNSTLQEFLSLSSEGAGGGIEEPSRGSSTSSAFVAAGPTREYAGPWTAAYVAGDATVGEFHGEKVHRSFPSGFLAAGSTAPGGGGADGGAGGGKRTPETVVTILAAESTPDKLDKRTLFSDDRTLPTTALENSLEDEEKHYFGEDEEEIIAGPSREEEAE